MSRSERLPVSDDRRGSDINVVNFSLIYQGLNIKAKCHMNHLPKQEHWPSGELRVDESRQVRLGETRRCGANPSPLLPTPQSPFPISHSPDFQPPLAGDKLRNDHNRSWILRVCSTCRCRSYIYLVPLQPVRRLSHPASLEKCL
jgi:hypothetical protein